MEDDYTIGAGVYESNQLAQKDCDRIKDVLNKIISEGRLISIAEGVNMRLQKIS